MRNIIDLNRKKSRLSCSLTMVNDMQLIIRDEIDGDINSIYRVNQQAFETNAEAELVNLLRASGKAVISLVAVFDAEIVGHILFSPMSIEPPSVNWNALGLAPVGVLAEFQFQGIGKALVKTGLERCRTSELNSFSCWAIQLTIPNLGF